MVLPAALGVIMLGLGLSLTVQDFKRIAEYPRGLAIGAFNLAIVAPMLALVIAKIYGLPAGLAIGLVLLGASPGGAMSNVITHWSRGDTALSISMTAISSVGALITVPLYIGIAAAHFGGGFDTNISMAGIVAKIFAITIIPIATGMIIRARAPDLILRSQVAISRITMGVFAAIIIGVLFTEGETMLFNITSVAAACLTLNVCAMGFSFGLAKASRLGNPQATAIAMELGIHNATLAIAVGVMIAPELTIPAAVYAGFMLFTAGGFAVIMARYNQREPVELAGAPVAGGASTADGGGGDHDGVAGGGVDLEPLADREAGDPGDLVAGDQHRQ